MNKYESMIGKAEDSILRHAGWLTALLFTAVFAGCLSGNGRPILGGVQVGGFALLTPASSVVVGGASAVINVPSVPVIISGSSSVVVAGPPGIISPGAICPVSASTIPTVTSSDPVNGNQSVTTGTNGGGKIISATFNSPMQASTINAASFTLTPVGSSALIPAVVAYNSADLVGTLTTAVPLQTNTSYTANITTAATSTTGVTMACSVVWNFKTAALASVNLGTAATFAIAATAGVTNTSTSPISHIYGDAVLDPLAQCNAVDVDATGGFGLCGSNPSTPTISGKVISHLYNAGVTPATIKADLLAAFLSISPPAGPPVAGSLGGATNIPAGTTLGGAVGLAYTPGTNYFTPGVYQSITSILITGDLTLDAQGNPDAVFVFQSSTTIGTADGAATPGVHTRILLVNGAKASNVWWQTGSATTLGAYSEFQGNILNTGDLTMNLGATSCGRLLAGAFTSGAFVLIGSNVISVPGNPSAPPSCQ